MDGQAFDEDGNRRLCGGDDFRCVLIGADAERIHGKVRRIGATTSLSARALVVW